jgi:deaminated glutathione amidase
VRREREVGLRGLGQPLKSFRDSKVDFAVYRRESFDSSFLASLGPLRLPRRPTLPGDLRRRRVP